MQRNSCHDWRTKGSQEIAMRMLTQKSLRVLQIFLQLKTLQQHTALRKKLWTVLSISEKPRMIWATKEPGFSKKTQWDVWVSHLVSRAGQEQLWYVQVESSGPPVREWVSEACRPPYLLPKKQNFFPPCKIFFTKPQFSQGCCSVLRWQLWSFSAPCPRKSCESLWSCPYRYIWKTLLWAMKENRIMQFQLGRSNCWSSVRGLESK